jgi:hypothetical protein
MVVGFCGSLLFLFVPESFWDRSPIPKTHLPSKSSGLFSRYMSNKHSSQEEHLPPPMGNLDDGESEKDNSTTNNGDNTHKRSALPSQRQSSRGLRVDFASEDNKNEEHVLENNTRRPDGPEGEPTAVLAEFTASCAPEGVPSSNEI